MQDYYLKLRTEAREEVKFDVQRAASMFMEAYDTAKGEDHGASMVKATTELCALFGVGAAHEKNNGPDIQQSIVLLPATESMNEWQKMADEWSQQSEQRQKEIMQKVSAKRNGH